VIALLRGAFVEVPDSPARRLGAGLFETVRWDGREARHWARHAARLSASLAALELRAEPLPGPDEAARLARRVGLQGRTGRINILCPFDDLDAPAAPLLLAAPYDPPPPGPVDLAVFPGAHASFLGRHKTMSHMPYLLARRHAARQGRFDALLADPDGLVVETATCSLVFADHDGLLAPAHPFALPGTALALAAQVLPMRRRPVLLDDLPAFRHAYVCNSLLGMRAVARIGDIVYEPDEAAAGRADAVIL